MNEIVFWCIIFLLVGVMVLLIIKMILDWIYYNPKKPEKEAKEMSEIICPCCNGTGKVQKDDNIDYSNPYLVHPNRTLPLEYYCSKCKQLVTRSHAENYCHKKFMHIIPKTKPEKQENQKEAVK